MLLDKNKLITWMESISSTFLRARFSRYFGAKNFKPKTQLCNFWRKNFVQKNARLKC